MIARPMFRSRRGRFFDEQTVDARQRIASLIGLFSDFIAILPWTEKEASAYADIRVALETAGTPIGSDDMFIAAVAKANDLTLVTNNASHFSKVPELKIENWISEGTEMKGTNRK